jgi:glycosyltransferase involved in cell wall biosynthesis
MSLSVVAFEFELDAPWSRHYVHIQTGKIQIGGWIQDAAGRPPKSVSILLGKRVIPTELRPALPPGRNEPGLYAFEAIFRTRPGLKWLRLQAEWQSGEKVIFTRRLLWAKAGRTDYQEWVRLYDQWDERKEQLSQLQIERWQQRPLISLVVPVYNPPLAWVRSMVDSVRRQVYTNWELILVDDASSDTQVVEFLHSIVDPQSSSYDKRIQVVHLPQNQHISQASNHGLQLAKGDWIGLLDHDDELAPHALYTVAYTIQNNRDARLIYSDEDKINAQEKRVAPYFKPDWNPDLLLSQNYLCHFTLLHRSLIDQGFLFRKGFEGAQDWDLFLRVTETLHPTQIVHIPEILYHWRIHSASTAQSTEAKPYVLERSQTTLQEALQRRGIQAIIDTAPGGYWRVRYAIPSPAPLVSLIIPTRDRLHLLRTCIESIIEKTTYPNFEIIIVDNDSAEPETLAYFNEISKHPRVRILSVPGPFNYSKLNNLGVKEARGSVLGFLNNDLEILHPDWLDEMVSQALRPEIGCVGCKLTYPDGSIQHAGVVLGILGVAGHIFRKFEANSPAWFQHIQVSRQYTAVTAACVLVRRDVYNQTRGFNEESLKVAFNDIDFCLQVHALGYYNLYTPFAHLRHHESASRGKEETAEQIRRFQGEIQYMKEQWGELLSNDPSYNPNLTLDAEDNGFSFPPRQKRPWQ